MTARRLNRDQKAALLALGLAPALAPSAEQVANYTAHFTERHAKMGVDRTRKALRELTDLGVLREVERGHWVVDGTNDARDTLDRARGR